VTYKTKHWSTGYRHKRVIRDKQRTGDSFLVN